MVQLRCSRSLQPTRFLSLSGALDGCYVQTSEAMIALHSTTGLPWVLTLPLAALILRTLFVVPLELWARKHQNMATQTRPLQSAWSPIIQAKVRRENHNLPIDTQRKLALVQQRAKRKELYKSLGIKTYPAFAPLLQLPVWLIAIETVRRMCGTREGLLGLVTRTFTDTEGATDGTGQVLSVVPVEPSLAFEGALWFPDLLVPDPQIALPFVLSALLFTNVTLGQRQQRSAGIEPTKWSTRITRIVKILALAVGPATLAMPSAVHVYWISSSASAILQHAMIRRLMPRPPTASPCKGRAFPAA